MNQTKGIPITQLLTRRPVAYEVTRAPIYVIAGTQFRLKNKAEREVRRLKRQFGDRKDISFVVRCEGWNRKMMLFIRALL